MRRWTRIVGSAILLHALCGASRADEPSDVGIIETQPAAGRFVRIGDRFMVAYQAKIPGTEISYEMMPIPAGRFVMGSPSDEAGRNKDEGPRIPVRVEAFWMGKCEVTWGEYRRYMKLYTAFKRFRVNGIRKVTEENEADAITAPTVIYDPDYRYEHGDDPRMPAVSMSHYGAKQYTHWLSGITGRFYRLPSEAEWEYACRAGTKTAFHFDRFDTELPDHAWFAGNSDDRSHLVGGKRPNAWGLYDMPGNVSEWVLDAYSPEGYRRLEMGGAAADVIRWPKKRLGRVVRGGSWASPASHCRSAARSASQETWWEDDPDLPQSPWWLAGEDALTVGFRIIRPWQVPAAAERNRYWDPDCDEVRDDVEDRLNDGRGVRGLVDPKLPQAIEKLDLD